MGFAPADDPQFLVLFIVREPGVPVTYGSVVAAPFAKDVLEKCLKYAGVAPSEPMDNLVEVPDLTGMGLAEAEQKAKEEGFSASVIGSGAVSAQSPVAGTKAAKGVTIDIYGNSSEPAGDSVTVPNLADKTLIEAFQIAKDSGLEIKVSGSEEGKVKSQSPKAGELIANGERLPLLAANKKKEGRGMKLRNLLAGIEYEIVGDDQVEICGVAYDSRKVQEGYLFFCIQGYQSDGHQYAKNAYAAGAVCLVVTKKQDLPITQVIVKDDRAAMALISAAFYGHPAKRLRMVGVTGTSGKTSTTYLLKSIFEHEGSKVGLMGTIVNIVGDKILPAERTTPEAPDLQRMLAEMLNAGVDTVVMEVSSHSLYLKRVHGIKFQGAIYTNLTQDHLDFHGDFEHYRDAKAILFQNAEHSAINADDPYGAYMEKVAAGNVKTYGIREKANIVAKILSCIRGQPVYHGK